jgi:UDP-N-acetylglucosamine diphosphorylase / glucose-1-phosphate thymidylyltransferase / UDP-N-acetylgalactosamine diphosphorylase / glucosamine-1-phosphate N-acetyltransferase / galactosamine-1-phosphate N-acetyltransferase
MSILLFEDDQVTQLYPITIGRPAFAISCGSFRLIDRVSTIESQIQVRVRPHLRAVHAADYPAADAPRSDGKPILLINARLVPSQEVLEQLQSLLDAGRGFRVHCGAYLAAALLPAGTQLPPVDAPHQDLLFAVERENLPVIEANLPLFDYPHDVVRHHLSSLAGNLACRLAEGTYQEAADGVFLADGATLGQHVVTDTRKGPILLERNATVGPYCFISGPAHLGPGARVIEHAAIKDGVSLGHTTKIGGEIEGSVIEPYTNKQHHGFLGHSYLGSWVNLGAGTCNSDLKNTYGQVNMEYWGHRVPTGMQFIGTIVGDYAKSAINTGIFTGKTIGACSMLYGFVTTNVPSFVNYARLFGQVTEAPVDVMVATQARMFARRSVSQRPCDIQLLYDMYELTRHERQLAGEPLSL